jgi:hypothetical protein
MLVSTPLRSRLLQLTPQLTPAILRRLRLLLRLGTNLGGIIRLAYCGGARGPVILPVFKAGDPSLRGVDGGFDSHTLPPNSFDSNGIERPEKAEVLIDTTWVSEY